MLCKKNYFEFEYVMDKNSQLFENIKNDDSIA